MKTIGLAMTFALAIAASVAHAQYKVEGTLISASIFNPAWPSPTTSQLDPTLPWAPTFSGSISVTDDMKINSSRISFDYFRINVLLGDGDSAVQTYGSTDITSGGDGTFSYDPITRTLLAHVLSGGAGQASSYCVGAITVCSSTYSVGTSTLDLLLTFSPNFARLTGEGTLITLEADGTTITRNFIIQSGVSSVPVPAASWLLSSAALALGGFQRRRRAKSQSEAEG